MDELSDDIVANQFSVLYEYSRSFAYFRTISETLDQINDANKQYWIHSHNIFLNDGILKWCKVFGADSSKIHWKKASPSIRFHSLIRERILANSGFTENEWKDYHKEMCDFRNTYSAHRDIEDFKPVPMMDKSLDVASSFIDFIVDNNQWAGHPQHLKETYSQYVLEIQSVLGSFIEKNNSNSL